MDNNHKHIIIIIIILLSTISNRVIAQQFPPIPFTIHTGLTQNLNFGAFFTGNNGGTIIIYPNGTRSSTGDVLQATLGYTFSPAIFEIEAQAGSRISILNGANTTLTGSNGGTMVLQVGASDPVSPFIISTSPPSRTQIKIGGILTVSNILANPVGSYNGNFSITIVQE